MLAEKIEQVEHYIDMLSRSLGRDNSEEIKMLEAMLQLVKECTEYAHPTMESLLDRALYDARIAMWVSVIGQSRSALQHREHGRLLRNDSRLGDIFRYASATVRLLLSKDRNAARLRCLPPISYTDRHDAVHLVSETDLFNQTVAYVS